MTKSELIQQIAERTNTSKTFAEETVNSFIELFAQGLKDEQCVKIAGLGSFRVRKRRARVGIDPKTHDRVEHDESTTVGFRPSRLLRERIGAVDAKDRD